MQPYFKHATHCLLLTIALIVIQAITVAILPPPNTDIFQSFEPDFTSFVAVSFIEATVIYFLIIRIRLSSQRYAVIKKAGIVFVMYWGSKYLQMQIEALFFLNIWQTEPIMNLSALTFILWSGLLTSIVFSVFAAFLSHSKTDESHPISAVPLKPLVIIMIATLYVFLYMSAGSVLVALTPSEPFANTYGDLSGVPTWLPVFQFLRGLLWAAIAWWVFRFHSNQHDPRITLSVCFWLFPAAQLLMPSPLMQEQLRLAHFLEMTSSMFIFGWVTAWIFSGTRNSLWRLSWRS